MKHKGISLLFVVIYIFILVGGVMGESLQDDTDVEFSVGGGIICSEDGREWLDYSGNELIKTSSLGSNNCFRGGDEVLGSKFCCPNGFKCMDTDSSSSGVNYECVQTDKNRCYLIKDQVECGEASAKIISDSAKESNLECGDITSSSDSGGSGICTINNECRCTWDNDEGCDVDAVQTEHCFENGNIEKTSLGTCIRNVDVKDNCETEGFKQVIWTSQPLNNFQGECLEGSKVISCEDVIRLPFFGFIQFMFVCIMLCLYYFFVRKESKFLR